MTTPLTKQYFRLEVIGLNLTDITWPENSKFLPSFEAFFAELNSAYSSNNQSFNQNHMFGIANLQMFYVYK